MAISMKMGLKQNQRMALTRSMIQSIQLLQLPILELSEKISNELLENPVLEEESRTTQPEISEEDGDILSGVDQELSGGESIYKRREEQRLNYEDYSDSGFHYVKGDDEKKQRFIESLITQEETLKQHLLSQARLLVKDEMKLVLIENIITSIDDNGFFTDEIEVIARENMASVEEVNKALSIINSLDPVGCGVHNIRESLTVQAELLYPEDEILKMILKDCYALLENLNYNKIAKVIKISVDVVISKSELIHNLNPFPGRQYSTNRTKYIIPDVEVKYVDEKVHVNLNNDWIPGIRINSYYNNFLRRKNVDENVKKYLKSKMDSARDLIKNISSRRDTIIKVVTAVMERQQEFLSLGNGHLNPLTIAQIAGDVGLHNSTISRAINGKYVQTSWGVFELKYFFVSGLKSNNVKDHSSDKVMSLISDIINSEDLENPLTDEDIFNKLKEYGIKIARRTVAKYRTILNIPHSNRRRRLNKIKQRGQNESNYYRKTPGCDPKS